MIFKDVSLKEHLTIALVACSDRCGTGQFLDTTITYVQFPH